MATTLLAMVHSIAAQAVRSNQKPLALHQLVIVAPGGDAVVSLRGYDRDGDQTKANVVSLPRSDFGTVHQLSKVALIFPSLSPFR